MRWSSAHRCDYIERPHALTVGQRMYWSGQLIYWQTHLGSAEEWHALSRDFTVCLHIRERYEPCLCLTSWSCSSFYLARKDGRPSWLIAPPTDELVRCRLYFQAQFCRTPSRLPTLPGSGGIKCRCLFPITQRKSYLLHHGPSGAEPSRVGLQSRLLYDRFIYLSLRLSNDMDVFWML